MNRNHRQSRAPLIAVCVLLVIAVVILCALLLSRCSRDDAPGGAEASGDAPASAAPTVYEPEAADVGGVTDLTFAKFADNAVRLEWTAPAEAERVVVLRRESAGSTWEQLAEVDAADGAYVDTYPSSEPQQYLYRVDVVSDAGDLLAKGSAIPASNISVCIDPGHYRNYSPLSTDNVYGYEEGTVMLQLGLELRRVLHDSYGIDAVMTRETDSITLGGYTDSELDNHHLTLRGEYAAGQDLFISLHSNANLDNANGYPTLNQPIGINKTLVFVNRVALADDVYMAMANAIGRQVTAVNAEAGLTTSGKRFTEGERDSLITWSDPFNDALDTPGTVCYRDGENHDDYYGVLRGAAKADVPGFIVEHGFHTVAEVRKAAMEGDLVTRWAHADAAGIAEGFGFVVPKA